MLEKETFFEQNSDHIYFLRRTLALLSDIKLNIILQQIFDR